MAPKSNLQTACRDTKRTGLNNGFLAGQPEAGAKLVGVWLPPLFECLITFESLPHRTVKAKGYDPRHGGKGSGVPRNRKKRRTDGAGKERNVIAKNVDQSIRRGFFSICVRPSSLIFIGCPKQLSLSPNVPPESGRIPRSPGIARASASRSRHGARHTQRDRLR